MNSSLRKMSLGIFLWGILLLGNAAVAYAQYIPLAPIETSAGKGFLGCTPVETRDGNCLPKYLRAVYDAGILLAGLFAVVAIVRGGFTLLWTDSILGHSEAKGIILRAVGGLLVVYSSFILMNLINPQLANDLNLSLRFPSIQVKKNTDDKLGKALTAQERIDEIQNELTQQLNTVNPQIRTLADAEQKARAAGKTAEADSIKEEYTLLGDVQSKIGLAKHNLQQGLSALWIDRDVAGAEKFRSEIYSQTMRRASELAAQGHEKEAAPLFETASSAYNELAQQISWYKQGCNREGTKTISKVVGEEVKGTVIKCK